MPFAWLLLNSLYRLGPSGFARLLERYGSPEAVLEESPAQLRHEGLITSEAADQLRDPAFKDSVQRQLDTIHQSPITLLTLHDDRYPQYLKEIFAPPPLLYVRGDPAVFKRHAVAVVGSRSPTVYGKHATANIVKELVESSFVIVSGLARGIDTVAHETCVAADGVTIAVLGCGVEEVYPRMNRALGDRILEKGCIVSEFPLGTPPESFNFPRRNRIISGLSAAVLVVEAGEKSGSLITAGYALQQGREVCAVPGPITSPLSRGTFNLIRDGATPVRSGRELAGGLAAVTAHRLTAGEPLPRELPESVFTDDERRVLDGLSDEPMRIDAIAERLGLAVTDLFMLMLNLELKGFVQQCSGQHYVRV
ncbi:MAG: DNA-processing protein DprA [Chitinispirillaceae bacterium]|nr:DNA-processing protein DprA [Chitinispirillaceae bacterium]